MKKALISLMMLIALVAFGVTTAEAATTDTIAVSVTITLGAASVAVAPDTWTFSLPAGPATQGCTASNDSTNYTEDLTIVCSDGGTWDIGPSAGPNIFKMTAVGGGLVSPTALDDVTPTTLKTDLPAAGSVDFTLEFTAPTSTDDSTDSMTVTVTAS